MSAADAARPPLALQRPQLMNGAQALATGFLLAGTRISYTYPITPQTEVMEYFGRCDDMRLVPADSEYNVLAGAEGVLWSGERCAVATSSQGLVLMSEVLWEVAGSRLPLVMGVFNRGLKTVGWCLGTQHNDSLSIRDTGWLQLYCETAQQLLDFVLIGYRLAETVRLPLIVVGDGFYLSHEQEEVWVPDAQDAQAFVGPPRFGDLPRGGQPLAFGGVMPPARYSQGMVSMHRALEQAGQVFRQVASEYAHRFGRGYGLLDPLYTADAEWVILATGTLSGTVRAAVEALRDQGIPVGQARLNAFRPFPDQAIHEALRREDGSLAPHLLVIDRDLAPGHGGIIAGEVRMALHLRRAPTRVHSFVAGLGGLDVTPEMVALALDHVRAHPDQHSPSFFLTEEGVE